MESTGPRFFLAPEQNGWLSGQTGVCKKGGAGVVCGVCFKHTPKKKMESDVCLRKRFLNLCLKRTSETNVTGQVLGMRLWAKSR